MQTATICVLMVHSATVSIPHNIVARAEKGVGRVPARKRQFVNVFTRQAAALEVLAGATIERYCVDLPMSAENFSNTGGGVITLDSHLLEQRAIKAEILPVCSVYGNIPCPECGTVKIGNDSNGHSRTVRRWGRYIYGRGGVFGRRGRRQSLFPVWIGFQFTDAENNQDYSERQCKNAEDDQNTAKGAAVFLLSHFVLQSADVYHTLLIITT